MSAMVTRDKIAAVLGMMGSEHDGEALAAARMAERLRLQIGATWSELLTERPPQPQPHRTTYRASPIRTWRDTCAELVKRKGCLNHWEVGFVSRLPDFRVLSVKQRRILDEIALRVLGSTE
jgi:hypothetical protein